VFTSLRFAKPKLVISHYIRKRSPFCYKIMKTSYHSRASKHHNVLCVFICSSSYKNGNKEKNTIFVIFLKIKLTYPYFISFSSCPRWMGYVLLTIIVIVFITNIAFSVTVRIKLILIGIQWTIIIPVGNICNTR
jgi:hypothetical protein